ncbi:MAG: bifunctional adenosylcobinamide kinase/adenosylcobinamide-phosphate guanylyltransferase [Elusimicrobiota bacterium]
MGKIIFILGGVKSGKSSFALKLVQKRKNVVFAATAIPFDFEMQKKIVKHKKSRPQNIKTIEVKNKISEILKENFDTVIIDCLTVFVSNRILSNITERRIIDDIKSTIIAVKKKGRSAIIVSNEVGMGIVPKNKLARKFRDILGNINQAVSEIADKVYLMVAGIPVGVKK